MTAASIAEDLLEDVDGGDGSEPESEPVDDGRPDGPPPSPDGEEIDAPGDSNSGGSVFDRLTSTEPNMSLSDPSLQDAVDLENGGIPRIKRGIYKLTNTQGATAAEDIVVGAVEWWLKHADVDAGESEDVEEELGAIVS